MSADVAVTVRCERHVVGRGKCGDLPPFRVAAADGGVRLDDIRGTMPDQVPEAPSQVLVLAGRHRDIERPAHLRPALVVGRGHGLLEPHHVESLDHSTEANGLVRSPRVVRIHHEIDVVTDGLPHRPDALDVFLEAHPPHLHLHRVVPHRDVAPHLLLELLIGLARRVVPAPDVRGHAVAVTAQQTVDGLPQGLADDVPERDIDVAHRPNCLACRSRVIPAGVHLPPKALDPKRVLPDHHVAERTLDQLPVPAGRTDAGDALVREHLGHREREGALRKGCIAYGPRPRSERNDRELDVGDLHVLPILSGRTARDAG